MFTFTGEAILFHNAIGHTMELDPVAHLVRYILTAHDRVCIADKAVCPSGRLA